MSKKGTLGEKIAYGIFLFLFKKASVLKKCATEALMKDLLDLNIFNGLLKFRDCGIMDIMTPRTEICAVGIESSEREIIKKIKKNTCHTKIPIYSTEQKNLSNQEETLQFKFLAVFKYNCIGGAFAVITEFFTGAISARFIAWFWEERSNH